MTNMLPAILFGGPLHAGKSVLFYSVTMALRQRGITHYAIRACPDGEGNWSQEIDQETNRLIRIKGKWSREFVEGICRDLSRRALPLLVDMGGRPEEEQFCILRNCTHSLLLLKSDENDLSLHWQRLVSQNGLLPLARLTSERTGLDTLTSTEPVIEGTITRLERSSIAQGPIFDALVERIISLFTYSFEELEQAKLDMAPTELVLNLHAELKKIAPQAKEWEPGMTPALLDDIPSDTPLSVYGIAPHWLYSVLAVHAGKQPFYQFSRIGWVQPPALLIDEYPSLDVVTTKRENTSATVLAIGIVRKHLDYLQANHLPFPPVTREKGVILDGSMPAWLVTALVRLYHDYGVRWVACHQPKLLGAVVVAARHHELAPGDLIPFSNTEVPMNIRIVPHQIE